MVLTARFRGYSRIFSSLDLQDIVRDVVVPALSTCQLPETDAPDLRSCTIICACTSSDA